LRDGLLISQSDHGIDMDPLQTGRKLRETGNFQKIEKSINSARDTQMNQRIRPCQLGVAFGDHPKSSKLLVRGYFCLSEERPSLKSAQHCIASVAAYARSCRPGKGNGLETARKACSDRNWGWTGIGRSMVLGLVRAGVHVIATAGREQSEVEVVAGKQRQNRATLQRPWFPWLPM
jgi:hypothetical protein